MNRSSTNFIALAAALLAGLLFGFGVIIGGMGNPAKVVNFFDVLGVWDASLAFVMGGALVVAWVGYRLTMRRSKPIVGQAFHLPSPQAKIDRRLIGGSLLFGIGWGLAGFCPGPALAVLPSLNSDVVLFVVGLIAGIAAKQVFVKDKS